MSLHVRAAGLAADSGDRRLRHYPVVQKVDMVGGISNLAGKSRNQKIRLFLS
jgi:hypothetical protein